MWVLLTGHFSKPYHMSMSGWSWCQEVIVKGNLAEVRKHVEFKSAQRQVCHHINAVWLFIMIVLFWVCGTLSFIHSNFIVNSCDVNYLGEKGHNAWKISSTSFHQNHMDQFSQSSKNLPTSENFLRNIYPRHKHLLRKRP